MCKVKHLKSSGGIVLNFVLLVQNNCLLSCFENILNASLKRAWYLKNKTFMFKQFLLVLHEY